jgi:hypothetical protein
VFIKKKLGRVTLIDVPALTRFGSGRAATYYHDL